MKINENLAISESGFLFNPSTGESFTVNPIGAEIIALMKEGKTETEISDFIIQSYEVELKSFQKDLHDFAEVLRHHQLLDQYEETRN
jgi:hypothetical protein